MDSTTATTGARTAKILVAEDEPGISLGLEDTLRFEGYEVEVVTDGATASRRAVEQSFDLILLDVMLPARSGFDVCRDLRSSGVRTPIIFLTARTIEADRVSGLNLGANDYVTKPFSPRELVARIRRFLQFVEESRQDRRQLESELEIASQVQRRLFPESRPPIAGLDYAGACRPARGVSGDCYDFIALRSGCLAILLADVCGKGMPAALLAASLHAAVRAYAADAHRCCGDLLAKVNHLLFETTAAERFATAVYAVYDPRDRSLTWANAGHCPPVIMPQSSSSSATRLSSLTPPVGMFPAMPSAQRVVRLNPGDRLFMFSDGITEAHNLSGEEFGEGRFRALLQDLSRMPAEQMCEAVLTQVTQFAGPVRQEDDLTVICARLAGSVTES